MWFILFLFIYKYTYFVLIILLVYLLTQNNIKLTKDYSKEHLFGSSKISFNCSCCNKENVKCFTYLIKRNTLCNPCVTIQSLPKKTETMLKKYGVEHPMMTNEVKNNFKKSMLDNHGVEHPSHMVDHKEKVRLSLIEKYGDEGVNSAMAYIQNDEPLPPYRP